MSAVTCEMFNNFVSFPSPGHCIVSVNDYPESSNHPTFCLLAMLTFPTVPQTLILPHKK